jgi:chorismate mutase
MQNRFPDLPMICDPSHITGKRAMIQEVSQQALDLNYDGLIIETHSDPDNAWSDSAQQITPAVLKQMFVDLKVRKITDDASEYNQKMTKLRMQIDGYDEKLLEIIGNRMQIVDKIGQLKKEKNVAILQNQRWNEILNKMTSEGIEIGLSPEFIMQLFKAIHQESINHQEKVMNK